MMREKLMPIFEEALFRRLGDETGAALVAGRYTDARRLSAVADWLLGGDAPLVEDIGVFCYGTNAAKEIVGSIVESIRRRKEPMTT